MPAKTVEPTFARLLESSRFRRSFWVIVLLIIYDPQPVGRNLLAEHAAISKPTAAQYLDDLSRLGLAIRQGLHDGYVLTSLGRQIAMSFLLPTQSREVIEVDASESKGQNFLPLDAVVVVKDFKNLNNLTTTTNPEESKVLTFTTRRVLGYTGLLFGRNVTQKGLDVEHIPPEAALAWVAQAYSGREDLHTPTGLIYRRLQAYGTDEWEVPEVEPGEILPKAYFEKLGLEGGVDPNAHYEWGDNADDDDVEPEPTPTVEMDLKSIQSSGMDLVGKWQIALGQLQMEMPKASFDTWVRDTQVVGWDAEQETLKVGVRNAYARDWLNSRLASTVKRMLVGILNRSVNVEFVVFVSTETAG